MSGARVSLSVEPPGRERTPENDSVSSNTSSVNRETSTGTVLVAESNVREKLDTAV